MVQLGDRVKDCVTGLEGIAIGRTKWITGCDQICVQPGIVDKATGKLSETYSFDETRLKVINAGSVKVPGSEERPGGPHPGY